jgi:hypothetical protein
VEIKKNVHMRRLFLLIALIAGMAEVMSAQSPLFSIFDQFEQPSERGEGKVVIHQPESLKKLVGTRIDTDNLDIINGRTYIKTEGFRIQVYSGNTRTSRNEAEQKQAQIRKLFPNTSAYLNYDAPFWKLHIGDYLSFEEASQMLRNLRSTFPQVKNEIYIIEDEINIPLEE